MENTITKPTIVTTSNAGAPEKPFVRKDIHQVVTDTIIKQLEAGTVPWLRPWKGESALPSLPHNAWTGHHYRGINILLLWSAALENNYISGQWASFKQWQEKKEFIRKGEKGTMIVYADTFEKEDEEGEIKKISFLKSSLVFNRCQLARFDREREHNIDYTCLEEKVDRANEFLENTGAVVCQIGLPAAYIPADDTIYMPDTDKFIDTPACTATEGFYATLFHELVHWTGAKHRLDRPLIHKFGEEGYAQEELTAELGAAFLCAEFGIATADKTNHAAYINNWLHVLKENKKCLITAASEASKAADHLKRLSGLSQ